MIEETKKKVGRNENCPCGSGYKYKKCCLPKVKQVSEQVIQASNNRLIEQSKKTFGGEEVYFTDQHKVKLSEIILELGKEWLDQANNKIEMENIITFTCTAWNIAVILPPEEHEAEITRFIKAMKLKKIGNDVREIIRLIIDKKNRYYPDLNRPIVNYEFIGSGEDFHLNVASVLPQSEAPELIS